MLLFFLVFFGLQIFVLFCCAAAGNDAASQELSDQEQLQFIDDHLIIFIYNPMYSRYYKNSQPMSIDYG